MATPRHLRRVEDQTLDARTLCGVKIPPTVTFPPTHPGPGSPLRALDEPGLYRTRPCPRCHQKATLAVRG